MVRTNVHTCDIVNFKCIGLQLDSFETPHLVDLSKYLNFHSALKRTNYLISCCFFLFCNLFVISSSHFKESRIVPKDYMKIKYGMWLRINFIRKSDWRLCCCQWTAANCLGFFVLIMYHTYWDQTPIFYVTTKDNLYVAPTYCLLQWRFKRMHYCEGIDWKIYA